jgi:uncharacterized membrane protein YedE/YeeE
MMVMDWLMSLMGGVLIAFSASLVLLFFGRIVGISGIFASLVTPGNGGDWDWKISFMIGLFSGGVLLGLLSPASLQYLPERPIWLIAIAGLLVGFGTRLGNGCTSGHGVCGIPRLSPRSLIAVATFMTTGVFAAVFSNAVWG